MTIRMKTVLLSACAALAITACGKKDADASNTDNAAAAENGTMLTGGSPVDAAFSFKGGEALDVEGFLSGMGMDGVLVFDSSNFDEKSGATVLTNVRMAGEESPFTVGRVELYGVNTDAVAAMSSGEPMSEVKDVFRKIRLYDLNGAFPVDGTEGSGTISIAGLDIDSFAFKAGAGKNEDDEGKSLAAAAKSVSLGGIAMKGFEMTLDDAPEVGNLVFTAKDSRIGSYKAGKFSGMSMAGMDYKLEQSDEVVNEAVQAFGPAGDMILNSPLRNIMFPKEQSGSIATVTWDGVVFSKLLGYLEKGEKPPVSAKNLLSIGGMVITDVTQEINGKWAGSVKKMTISPIEFEHFMPKAIKILSEGEKYDFTAYAGDELPEIAKLLKQNGLDKITGNSKLNYAYSSKAQTISVDIDSVAKGLMNSNFSLNLGGFDYEALIAEDEGSEAAAMGITVEGMTLRLDDQKMLDTGFAIAGLVTEQDASALRQQVVGLISLGALQGGAISQRIPDYASALSTFISEGGALEIKLAPSTPASFGSIAAAATGNPPGEILETLNVTVTQSK